MLAAMDYITAEFHQVTWNHYLMLRCVLAHNAWNAISDLALWRSFNAFRGELRLPSASTFSNICRREYSLTVDTIMKRLPSRNKVSLPVDAWTSTNKLAMTSVIAYYTDWTWALWEVQHPFEEVDSLFFSYCECQLRIIGPRSTYRSNAIQIFEGGYGSFRAYRWPFTCNYHW